MNILLWIIQAPLALFYIAGGAYKTFAFDVVAKELHALSRRTWGALGVLEMVGGVLLIVPAATGWQPFLTPLAAAVLSLEALVLSVIYAQYSRKIVAHNPLVWGVVMALLSAFVAYGRYFS